MSLLFFGKIANAFSDDDPWLYRILKAMWDLLQNWPSGTLFTPKELVLKTFGEVLVSEMGDWIQTQFEKIATAPAILDTAYGHIFWILIVVLAVPACLFSYLRYLNKYKHAIEQLPPGQQIPFAEPTKVAIRTLIVAFFISLSLFITQQMLNISYGLVKVLADALYAETTLSQMWSSILSTFLDSVSVMSFIMFMAVITVLGTLFVVAYVKRMVMFFWGTVELFLYVSRGIEDPNYPIAVPLIRYFKHLCVLMFTTLLFLAGPAILYGLSVKGLFLVLSTGIYLWVSIKIPSMLGDYLDLVAERIELEDASIQKDYLEREKTLARWERVAVGVAFPKAASAATGLTSALEIARTGNPDEVAAHIRQNFKKQKNNETSENAYKEYYTPDGTSAEGKTASRGSGYNNTSSIDSNIDRFSDQLAEKYPAEFLKSINTPDSSLGRGKLRLALIGLIEAKYDAGAQLPYESVLSEAQEQVRNMSSDDFAIWVSKGSEFLLRFKGARL